MDRINLLTNGDEKHCETREDHRRQVCPARQENQSWIRDRQVWTEADASRERRNRDWILTKSGKLAGAGRDTVALLEKNQRSRAAA